MEPDSQKKKKGAKRHKSAHAKALSNKASKSRKKNRSNKPKEASASDPAPAYPKVQAALPRRGFEPRPRHPPAGDWRSPEEIRAEQELQERPPGMWAEPAPLRPEDRYRDLVDFRQTLAERRADKKAVLTENTASASSREQPRAHDLSLIHI